MNKQNKKNPPSPPAQHVCPRAGCEEAFKTRFLLKRHLETHSKATSANEKVHSGFFICFFCCGFH